MRQTQRFSSFNMVWTVKWLYWWSKTNMLKFVFYPAIYFRVGSSVPASEMCWSSCIWPVSWRCWYRLDWSVFQTRFCLGISWISWWIATSTRLLDCLQWVCIWMQPHQMRKKSINVQNIQCASYNSTFY